MPDFPLRQVDEAAAEHRRQVRADRFAQGMADAKTMPPIQPADLSRFGARTIGTFTEITVGCRVWSWTELEGDDRRLNHHGEPRGGIVIEIVDARADQYGEITQQRGFRTFNPHQSRWDLAWTTLTETQTNPAASDAGDVHQTLRVFRRMAEHLAAGKGPLTNQDVQLQADMRRLTDALLGHTH